MATPLFSFTTLNGSDYGLDNSFIGGTTATNQNTFAGTGANLQPSVVTNYIIKI